MKYLFLTSVSVVAFANVAIAQDMPAKDGNASGMAQATYQTGIADIVVTASRRSETVQRSALSIQALSSDDLSRASVTRPEDLSAVAPGVSVATGGNTPQVYIRGIGNFSTNAFAEGAVAFSLDGVYISRANTTRGMFFDLERVEVLKGPQGTLYGRNASGGAINVISAKPKLGEFSGFGEFQAGNYAMVQASGALNVPLGDTVALRASGQIVSRDGYLSDGYEDEKTQSARLQFKWEPTSDLSILIDGNYQHAGGNGSGAVLKPQIPGDKFRGATDSGDALHPGAPTIIQAQPAPPGFLLVFPRTDGFVDYTTYAVGAELNWDFGFANLTVLPAYRESRMRDMNYVPGFSVAQSSRDKQTSLEVRLSNASPDLKWVLGGYYFDLGVTNLPGEFGQVAAQGVSTFITDQVDGNTRSYAAFGQATYSLTDKLRITGGLRYTYERKSISQFLTNYALPTPGGACNAGFFDITSPTPPRFCHLDVDQTGVNAIRLTFDSVTWKAGIEYDLGPQSMAYANASTGFKSGGFFAAPPPNTFRPEKLTAFDVGMKNRFFDSRLQVNAEAYFWLYKDHQENAVGPTSIPGFAALLTYNAGQAKSYGAEIDVVFKATPRDEFSATIQYNKTKYDSFQYNYFQLAPGDFPVTGCNVGPLQPGTGPLGSYTVDCSGQPLMRAPEWTGTAGYQHDFDLGDSGTITAAAQVQFSSSQYLSTDFLQTAKQDAFAIGNFDLTFTSRDEHVSLSAFVHNVWNEAVHTQAFRYPFVNPANPLVGPDGVILGTLRPPRTFGVRARYDF